MYSVTCAHITCVCAISTKPYVYTRLAHIFGHMEFVPIARACMHAFIRDRRRHFASALARIVRPRARDPIDVVARVGPRRRARRREESSDSVARARALGIHSIHLFVPAVRRDNSSGRLDLPTRWVDAREG